jgi:hypothetical protein
MPKTAGSEEKAVQSQIRVLRVPEERWLQTDKGKLKRLQSASCLSLVFSSIPEFVEIWCPPVFTSNTPYSDNRCQVVTWLGGNFRLRVNPLWAGVNLSPGILGWAPN